MNPSHTTTSPLIFGSQQAASVNSASVVSAPKNVMQRIGFGLLLIYLIALLGLLTEVSQTVFGFKPYLSITVGPAAIAVCFFSGHLLRLTKTATGVFTILFLVWLLVAAPFTTWRTGTLETMTDVLFRTYSIVFMMVAFTTSLQDCRRLIYGIALGGFTVFLATWFYGGIGYDGRFSMSFGSLSNPNDLATHLLFILPFCLMVAATTRQTKTIRPLAIIVSLFMLYFTLKTASRSGIIAIAVMSLVLLAKASNAQRVIAAGSIVILLAASAVALPSTVWQRFASIYGGDTGENDVAYAAASRDSRIALLQRSVEVTLTHPVFGVGPGVFIASEAGEATEKGRRAAWVGTHNSYTEVSAEAGIPALIFFAASLLLALRSTLRTYRAASKRADLREMTSFALFLTVALAGLGVNLFFSQIAYRYYVPTILGLTICLELIARERLRQAQQPAKSGVTSLPMPRPMPQASPEATVPARTYRFRDLRKAGVSPNDRPPTGFKG
ncbi:MAG: O-antigen ligase family protein [Acidobacteriota bacterium]